MRDEIRFLGTAGARFVMIKQLRSSAGIFLTLRGTNILVDPGPGTLVRFAKSKPRIDPAKLHAIVLTHKHLDHSNDVNVMIEAMTEGGFKRRGTLICPKDAISDEGDAVVLKYCRELIENIETMGEGKSFFVGNLEINTPKRHVHGVETYGLNIFEREKGSERGERGESGKRSEGVEGERSERRPKVSFVADTLYFEGLERIYNGEVLVMNVAMFRHREGVLHLCVDDARKILKEAEPKVAILTHFGMTMLRHNPEEIAKRLSDETGVRVIAARDGMRFDLNTLKVF